GGVMVPLNEKQRLGKGGAFAGAGGLASASSGAARSAGGELFIDLMALLEVPVLLVARSTLGTINHTLLTLDALRRRGVPVAGVVLNGPPDDDNREAIERYGDVRVIDVVGSLERTPEAFRAA